MNKVNNNENCFVCASSDENAVQAPHLISTATTGAISRGVMLPATDGFPFDIKVIAENLNVPWAIDISNDGNIYFTERFGDIRVVEDGKLNPKPLMSLRTPFICQGEGGLMGLVLDPDFMKNHYIYVMYTYFKGYHIYNRVARLIKENNTTYLNKVLIDKIPGGRINNGGRLKIGPDKKLYITTGDAGYQKMSQNLASTAGKILRIELDGKIPVDNPINNSPVYSFGHRNPQGLAWNQDKILYASEHGQSANDEINIINPGANYGWPLVQGDEVIKEINIRKPLIHSGTDTWAPSGIDFVNHGPWKGNLIVASLRGEQLIKISLNNSGQGVIKTDYLIKNDYGRLREVIQAKDGSIYITTSNMDGSGKYHNGDDKIIRLSPKNV